MTRPVLSAVERRTLEALCRVRERDGRASVRTVAAECRRGLQATHTALERLSYVGYVDGLGTCGALRPAAGVVLMSRGLMQVIHLEEAQ